MSDKRILVYHYRHNGSPAVKRGLSVITKAGLERILETRQDLQATEKYFPRGIMALDVYQHDLYTPEQRSEFGSKANYNANIAGIKLPLRWVIRHALCGSFGELIILSAKR